MKRILCSLFLCGLSAVVFSQSMWNKTTLNGKELKSFRTNFAETGDKFSVDLVTLKNVLSNAPDFKTSSFSEGVIVEFPLLNGKMQSFYVVENSNFSPELQAEYPNIRSYRGIAVDNPLIKIAFSVSPEGLHTFLQTQHGSQFIEPISEDNSVYGIIERTAHQKGATFECLTEVDGQLGEELINNYGNIETLSADDQVYREYRLAISCTGEYAQYHGGTVAGALDAMNTTMTRVNGVFENDFAVHMNLIANNADVVYTNPATDPYTNQNAWSAQLQATLTSVIGEANYDIGHLFGGSGGGGFAGCIGCVCVNGVKGSGYTSPANAIPETDTFDIDYVAHEMGHQFGANHTFSASEGSGANMEPGSGSTIMGYAGITNANVQNNSDDYFHSVSIQQITTYISNTTCDVETNAANQPPTVDAGPSYTIPVGTAFKLTATGSDPDGDAVTYCWEQFNTSNSGDMSFPTSTQTTGPVYRSLPPTTSPTRYFPRFEDVLAGNLYPTWEKTPDVSRSLTFRVQARDNNANIAQNSHDNVNISVNAAGGPFKVSNIAAYDSFLSDSAYDITWDVAGTAGAPFNVSNVNIYLSTDGGENFMEWAMNTPNDGSENLTVPSGSTSTEAYIMIESVNNIFYAVSPNILINYSAEFTCDTFTSSNTPMAIPDGLGNSNPGAFAVVSVPVTGVDNIFSIEVSVDVTHTYIGDLLIATANPNPGSTQISLIEPSNCSENDMQVTFTDDGAGFVCASPATGDVLPVTPLSTFVDAQTLNGNWLVGFRDYYSQDTGTVNSVELEFCSVEFTQLGTSDISNDKLEISVYPNPSNGIYNVSFESFTEKVQFNVYDASGKLVKSFTENVGSGKVEQRINLTSAPIGTYILTIDNGKSTNSVKLIKK